MKSLGELVENIAALDSEVDSLKRRHGGLAPQGMVGGSLTPLPQAVEEGQAEKTDGDKSGSSLPPMTSNVRNGIEKDGVRVPRRAKDLTRWRATWRAVKSQYEAGTNYVDIVAWLSKVHPNLTVSTDVLADIIRAGVAGRLDA
jgi:hypothetical protein